MKKLLLKSIISLTLSTYHISQTNQNLSTHLHQPNYTNPFQMKKLLLISNKTLTLSTYHISQTDQNQLTYLHQPDYTNPFQMKKLLLKSNIVLTLSGRLPIKSARLIRTYQHIFISQTIPIHSRWKKLLLMSNEALTLSTYHISQTDWIILAFLHQPDYTK